MVFSTHKRDEKRIQKLFGNPEIKNP